MPSSSKPSAPFKGMMEREQQAKLQQQVNDSAAKQ